MEENISIPSYEPTDDILDFDYLKRKGIESLQKYAGKVWTDYNIHDPGITLLETFCFTLTEMGYRCRFRIGDLLELPVGANNASSSLPAEDFLFINPLTESDYRKLILNVENVRNAYARVYSNLSDYKGLWEIVVEPVPNTNVDETIAAINKALHQNRNLCEDFREITLVEYDEISFHIELEITGTADTKQLLNNIYRTLEEFLNPVVTRYGIDDLLSRSYPVDEIYDGPKPKNGFIVEDELMQVQQPGKLYISDLFHLLMDFPDIEHIRKLKIFDSKGNQHKWVCPVGKNKSATLNVENTEIALYLSGKKIGQEHDKRELFDKGFYQSTGKASHKILSRKTIRGEYVDVASYRSVMNDLPEFYGIGEAGLSNFAPPLRKGQANQLKAYMLLFDQLNLNFLLQLENLAQLFSNEKIDKTYFTQAIKDAPGIEMMYVPFIKKCQTLNIDLKDSKKVMRLWKKERETVFSQLENSIQLIAESEKLFTNRRNKLLDHLLARFSIKFEEVYRNSGTAEPNLGIQLINKKIDVLKHLYEVTNYRAQAINLSEIANTQALGAGFDHLVQKLAGFNQASLLSIDQFEYSRELPETHKGAYFKFPNIEKSNVFNTLSRWGASEINYKVETDQQIFRVKLTNGKHVLAEYSESYKNENEATDAIKQLAAKVRHENALFETVYVFEHILLRPSEEAKAYHFQFIDELGNPVFSSPEPLSFEERAKALKNIIRFGQNPDNYSIVNMGSKQYKFMVLNNHKNEIAVSDMYYQNEEEAKTIIAGTISAIVKIAGKKVPLQHHVNEYAENIFPDIKLKEVYSNMVTYAIPSWPAVFQDEHNRVAIERKLMELTPAHIYANIKWMDRHLLLKSVDRYFDILKTKQSGEADPQETYRSQKEFFKWILA
jgi:hypothetical protein